MEYRIRFHPKVGGDLNIISELLRDYSGPAIAEAKILEIQATIRSLAAVPHRGSVRDEIGAGIRAIPAGRKGVVVFRVDDDLETVFILAITYGGANWIGRTGERLHGPV